MKFSIILFCVIFCLSYCFSQDSTNKVYFTNGQLKSFQIKKDSLNFYEKSFYENGNVSGEGSGVLRNGKFVAKNFKRFYETGELWYSIDDSLSLSYETNGQVYMKIRLIEGVKNGLAEYYLNGNLILEVEYKNDLKNGMQITYDSETKRIQSEETYIDGKLHGPVMQYDRIGRLKKKLFYQDNCITKVIYFNSLGKVIIVLADKKSILLSEGKSIDCKTQ